MKQLLLLVALPGALLAQTLEGTWQGTLNPPNQNDGIRLAFKIEDLFTAFQEQLGLKLNTTKVPAAVLVIDNVPKPSEN
jgi:uncharacterized protein (TIGR03435 family)